MYYDMTDNQKKLLKLLYELKKDEKIDFEEYFDLLECVIKDKRVEYIPTICPTYPTCPEITSPWVSPWYYTTTKTSDCAYGNTGED